MSTTALPQPAPGLLEELGGWWRGLGPRERIAAAVLAGAAGGWMVWQLLNFSIGFDSSLYHYPLVAGWIENGSPGSGLFLSYDIPYRNYPLTDEVTLTWAAAISRSWVPLAIWSPAMVAVLAAAGWTTLRNLSVPRWAAGLGVGAVVTAPLVVRQLNEPQTDLPALAWLACVGALATGAARRPALLAPAVVAAGLAVGTKPSTGPLVVGVLAVGAYSARDRLRPLAGVLAAALAGAFVVGGIWYLRNLIEHGSPLWPFAVGPFGDPAPRFLGLVDATFLKRPQATLDGNVGDYLARLGGTWLLLAGALVALALGAAAPRLRALRRPLVVAGGLALASCLIWSTAWGTGLSTSPELTWPEGFVLSSLRYLLPAIGVAAVAVAIVARARRLARARRGGSARGGARLEPREGRPARLTLDAAGLGARRRRARRRGGARARHGRGGPGRVRAPPGGGRGGGGPRAGDRGAASADRRRRARALHEGAALLRLRGEPRLLVLGPARLRRRRRDASASQRAG